MNEAAKRREAIAKIEGLRGGVYYYDAGNYRTSGSPPGWLSWLRLLHGDERLGNASSVIFLPDPRPADKGVSSDPITNDELAHLSILTSLGRLHLILKTGITDAGLVHLKNLRNLQDVCLCGANITDAGLGNLKGLKGLQVLDISGTKITDAGLIHLQDLPKLEWIELSHTQVTDEGVRKLQEALPNCKILH